jgi:hypothetical protein
VGSTEASVLVMVKAAWEPQNALCGNLTMFRDDLSGIGDLNTYLGLSRHPHRRHSAAPMQT